MSEYVIEFMGQGTKKVYSPELLAVRLMRLEGFQPLCSCVSVDGEEPSQMFQGQLSQRSCLQFPITDEILELGTENFEGHDGLDIGRPLDRTPSPGAFNEACEGHTSIGRQGRAILCGKLLELRLERLSLRYNPLLSDPEVVGAGTCQGKRHEIACAHQACDSGGDGDPPIKPH